MRIGIVGTENSHAEGVVRYLNIDRRFPDHRVTALADGPADRNRQLADLGGIATVAEQSRDLIGTVDAVIVCARDGRRHRDQTLPLLSAAVPVFVDKPFACDVADARTMLAAAARHDVAISSFSALRWTTQVTTLAGQIGDGMRTVAVSGPADPASEHGGLHFYGVHVVEIALALVSGHPLECITVADCDDAVVATARAGETDVLLEFVKPRDGQVIPWRVATTGAHGSTVQQLRLTPDYDLPALDIVLRMFENGRRPLPDRQLLAAVAALVAIAGGC